MTLPEGRSQAAATLQIIRGYKMLDCPTPPRNTLLLPSAALVEESIQQTKVRRWLRAYRGFDKQLLLYIIDLRRDIVSLLQVIFGPS